MNFVRVPRHTLSRGLQPRPIATSNPYLRQFGRNFSTTTIAMAATPQRHFQRPAVFVCDMQEKFRGAIWQFDKILLTAQKVLRAAQILQVPVFVTTQNAARLGGTVSELEPLTAGAQVSADKTAFSMMRVPELAARFPPAAQRPEEEQGSSEVAIVGIESHICVTQTALDLLARGHRVYVLADGVSSCNAEEVPLALARLRAAGAVVTTSEGWLYECMGDAGIAEFRDVAKLVKETSAQSKGVLSSLLSKI
ncbi:Isochorismatase hydrolase [Hypoxylon sp. FL0543]|nr:Isochorismatase hydrolase [Hypoxylon sp. FL0543]